MSDRRKAFVVYGPDSFVCVVNAASEERALLEMARWWFDAVVPIELPAMMPPGHHPEEGGHTRLDNFWEDALDMGDDLCCWDELTDEKREEIRNRIVALYIEANTPGTSITELRAKLDRLEAGATIPSVVVVELRATLERLEAA